MYPGRMSVFARSLFSSREVNACAKKTMPDVKIRLHYFLSLLISITAINDCNHKRRWTFPDISGCRMTFHVLIDYFPQSPYKISVLIA